MHYIPDRKTFLGGHMKKKLVFMFMLCTLLWVRQGIAEGGFMPGTQLSDMGKAYGRFEDGKGNREDSNLSNLFKAYVVGAADALLDIGYLCMPGQIKAEQVSSMVSKYLKDHPEEWYIPGSKIVYKALSPTFACKGKAK